MWEIEPIMLQDFIEGLGYPHMDESRNPACQRLLCEG